MLPTGSSPAAPNTQQHWLWTRDLEVSPCRSVIRNAVPDVRITSLPSPTQVGGQDGNSDSGGCTSVAPQSGTLLSSAE